MENQQTETPDEVTKPPRSPSPPKATTWPDWVARGSTWLTIIAAVLSGLVGFYITLASRTSQVSTEKVVVLTQLEMQRINIAQDDKLEPVFAKIKELEQHLSSISNIPKDDALYIELQKVSNSVSDLNSREAKIESVILENPSKALETPLLRRDLDNVKESQQAAILSLKDSVDRIYDLNKWLLGAMAISIVTLAAGNLLKPKETKS